MPYNDALQANARFLGSVKSSGSDEALVRLVELQRIKESISKIFRLDTPSPGVLSVDTIELTITSFAHEVNAIEAMPPNQEPFFRGRHSLPVSLHVAQSSK